MSKVTSKLILLALSILLLSGCTTPSAIPEETTTPTLETEPTTIPEPIPTTVPEPIPTTVPEATPTEPEHSPLYIPGLSVEDVITYFNEVCLDAEMVNSGDASRLQKWAVPICYSLEGAPTDRDMEQLEQFTAWLNNIDGFPGISEAQDEANLRIHFCTQQEMLELMGDGFTDMDGAVTFWYSEDEIYDAIICCRTDLTQELRNSVILEEIYNGLGPIQDTCLREDSIIYNDYTEPQALSPVDELILKLLYHPSMTCGMDAEQCEAVLRQLYY